MTFLREFGMEDLYDSYLNWRYMRPLWTGALSFGLINIPIRLFKGSDEKSLSFVMLHKKDLSPIKYVRICKADGKEVPYNQIVKGYEYEKGDYVVLMEEDFKKANLKKTSLIEIVDFTNEKEIDSIFFEKPYFLEPGKGASKPYSLLYEALKKSKKVGIAKFVLHNHEHVGVLKPYKNILILEQMHFSSEIRDTKEIEILQQEKPSPKEINMALKLIEQLTTHFKPEEFHDTYQDELKEIIEKKAHGRRPVKKGKEPKITPVKDIMSMLKESLEYHQNRKTA